MARSNCFRQLESCMAANPIWDVPANADCYLDCYKCIRDVTSSDGGKPKPKPKPKLESTSRLVMSADFPATDAILFLNEILNQGEIEKMQEAIRQAQLRREEDLDVEEILTQEKKKLMEV